jgi:DNA end-binding protein Ku
MHQREYTVLIRPRLGGLTLHTMYYADDIREVEGYGRQSGVELKSQEVELAKKLVESLAAAFQPDKYRDDYQVKLREMIEAKQRGEEVATAEPRRMAPIIDMMEALQKSLAMTAPAPKKPAAREEAQEAAVKAPDKRRRVKTRAAG